MGCGSKSQIKDYLKAETKAFVRDIVSAPKGEKDIYIHRKALCTKQVSVFLKNRIDIMLPVD